MSVNLSEVIHLPEHKTIVVTDKPEILQEKWTVEQLLIASQTENVQKFNLGTTRFIGGLDISFVKNSSDAIVCLVIYDFETMEIVKVFSLKCKIEIPYIPYFLGYREVPAYLALLEQVKTHFPEFFPDFLIVDGNGFWHPLKCGAATHLAVLANIPTIGISKTYLWFEGMLNGKIFAKSMEDQIPNKGDYTKVQNQNGEIIGIAYNSSGTAKKCIYISVGAGFVLDEALQVVLSKLMIDGFRVNGATRPADLISRQLAK